MKVSISFSLPDAAAMIAGLDPKALYPALAVAEAKLAADTKAVTDARARLADLERLVAALPERVAAGTAKQTDLEAALTSKQAATLTIAPLEKVMLASKKALAAEKDQARSAVIAEAERRRAVLAAAAEKLWPALAEIKRLELELCNAAGASQFDFLGGARWPVPHPTWRAGLQPPIPGDTVRIG